MVFLWTITKEVPNKILYLTLKKIFLIKSGFKHLIQLVNYSKKEINKTVYKIIRKILKNK